MIVGKSSMQNFSQYVTQITVQRAGMSDQYDLHTKARDALHKIIAGEKIEHPLI